MFLADTSKNATNTFFYLFSTFTVYTITRFSTFTRFHDYTMTRLNFYAITRFSTFTQLHDFLLIFHFYVTTQLHNFLYIFYFSIHDFLYFTIFYFKSPVKFSFPSSRPARASHHFKARVSAFFDFKIARIVRFTIRSTNFVVPTLPSWATPVAI